MITLVQSDLAAQKIRIEAFCKRVLIVLLVGLPILSAVFNIVSWLRYGVDLPFLDDIRPYYHETAGSLKLHDLFTSSNDTLYPLGMALDSLAFRWLSGNTIAYQAISMTLVLGGILLIQWKLLEYCLNDKLLSAAAFSSLLIMLQPDSYWGLQNMAYHQVLPLLFILTASLVSVSSFGTKLKCTFGILLATASGLVYISGAFAFLAFSVAMLTRELFVVKKSPQVMGMAISMLLPSILTSLLQGWVIVGIQHGIHRADTAMAYPWDAEFWIFILSKIARSLYLSEIFPFLSLGIASADSTPSGHSAHQHPDTRSTLIRTGSRSAATQVCIVSLKPLPTSISLRACASTRPLVRSDKRCAPDGRGSHRPRSDRRSTHAICPPAFGW
ncbi:membrane protein [Pseudomonas syringae pv. avii]|uniref:Membrane protein n=1 Tax=Pseudomonas syringae pv. avii TaxID=663959 RepID=A0ABY1U9R1_PSESX|nr:membrane protein [Pseudomonas syringae pv. avii]